MAGHSKVQKAVLSLYKTLMRAADSKPGFRENIQMEFKKNKTLYARTDTVRIEMLLRNGKRKLAMIQDPQVSGMGNFVENKK